MSTLNPEQRPDKNGNVVTRWVKPITTTGGGNLSVPAPALPKNTINRDTFDDDISDLIGHRKYEDDDYTKFIAKASDETLQYIMITAKENSDNEDMLSCLSGILHDNVEDAVAIAFLATYDKHDGLLDDNGIVDYLRGALESGSNLPEKYDPTDEQRNQELHNLYTFMIQCDSMRGLSKERKVPGVMNGILPAVSYKIEDEKLADCIRKYPEHIDTLNDVVNGGEFTIGALHYAIDHPEDTENLINALNSNPQLFAERDASGVAVIMENFGDGNPLIVGTL